jgi:hypothetical protein
VRVRLGRTFLGIKILGGCFRLKGCGGLGFCGGFGPLPAGVSVVAVKGRLDFTSEGCAAVDLGLSRGTPRDVVGGWVNEGLRAGTSPGGRGVETGFEGEARGLCADAEACEPMLRAGTSVSGIA